MRDPESELRQNTLGTCDPESHHDSPAGRAVARSQEVSGKACKRCWGGDSDTEEDGGKRFWHQNVGFRQKDESQALHDSIP